MKPFLGNDITKNTNNDVYDGEEFIVTRPSPEMKAQIERAREDAMKIWTKGLLSKPLWIVVYVCFLVAVGVTSGIIESLGGDEGVTLAQAFQDAPWLFVIAAVAWVAGIALSVVSKRRYKSATQSRESDQAVEKLNSLAESVLFEMGVPSDAPQVELISFSYKLQNGECVPTPSISGMSAYDVYSYHAYVSDGKLCFADADGVYALDPAQCRAIRTVKEKIELPVWCKDVEHTDPMYAPYEITEAKDGDITIGWYHILEMEHNGEMWGVYFPNYELPAMQALTGLTAE